MKKFFMSLVIILAIISCNESPEQHKKLRVTIVQPQSHSALNESIKGFKDGLEEKFDITKIEIIEENANGDLNKISSIVKKAISEKSDLIFCLTSAACEIAINLTNSKKIPLVYTAVTDPVDSKIVTEMEKSSTYATGVSDRYPVDKQVELFLNILPNMRTAGLLYNPSEKNSQILVYETERELIKKGITPNRYMVSSASMIPSKVKLAVLENDCIIINGDNSLIENLQSILNISIEYKKPFFVGDPESVVKGAVCTVGPSYFSIGKTAGYKAAEILHGKDPRTIPSEHPRSFDYIINTSTAKLLGLEIPDNVWYSRTIWQSKEETTSN